MAGLNLQRDGDVARADAQPDRLARRKSFADQFQPGAIGVDQHDAIFRLDLANYPLDQRARLLASERIAEIEPPEDLRCRSGSEHPSLFEHDHRVGEPRHFVDLVADIDDRDGRLVADRLDIG